MATTSSTSTPQMQTIGQYVELAGIGSLIVGAILSVHHYAIGLCIIAGARRFMLARRCAGLSRTGFRLSGFVLG